MTRTRRVIGVVFVFLLTLGVIPASAQDSGENVLDDPSQLAGIQYGVSRSWSTAQDMSTPPAAGASFAYFAGVAVFEFDSEANAGTAFGTIREFLESNAASELGIAEAELAFEDLDAPGDNAFAMSGAVADDNEQAYFRYIVVQDGLYVYYSGAVSTDEESAGIADDIVAYVGEQDADASGLGEFNEDGTSSGGLWELLPAADDEMLADLAISSDEVQYPVEEEEAA